MCNGRTFNQRSTAGGYTVGLVVGGTSAASPASVLGRILTDPARCPLLMDGAHTRVEISAAHDLKNAYVLILD